MCVRPVGSPRFPVSEFAAINETKLPRTKSYAKDLDEVKVIERPDSRPFESALPSTPTTPE